MRCSNNRIVYSFLAYGKYSNEAAFLFASSPRLSYRAVVDGSACPIILRDQGKSFRFLQCSPGGQTDIYSPERHLLRTTRFWPSTSAQRQDREEEEQCEDEYEHDFSHDPIVHFCDGSSVFSSSICSSSICSLPFGSRVG